MAKAIKVYKGGIFGLVEAAIRDDGVEFRRYQNKTMYGYRWTAWRASGQRHDVGSLPGFLSSGFSNLWPSERSVRLPN